MQRLAIEDDSLSQPDSKINASIHHLSIGDESMSWSYSQLDDSELNTTIDTSQYQPDTQVSSSETSSGDDLPTSSQATRRALLNDFLRS